MQISQALAAANAVFDGTVLTLEKRASMTASSADSIRVAFNVHKLWKGRRQSTLTVRTARDESACGYEFEEGGRYLVYASGDARELQTTICSRTKPLDEATEDIAELDESM